MSLKLEDINVGDTVSWRWNAEEVCVGTVRDKTEVGFSTDTYYINPNSYQEEWATLRIVETAPPAAATKFDASKLRLDLIPSIILKAFAWPYHYGETKYPSAADGPNWKRGMKFSRALAALKRHLYDFESGQDFDPASGSRLLAQVAWYCGVIIWYQVTGLATKLNLDDRDKRPVDVEPFYREPTEPYKDGKPLFTKESP